MLHSHQLSVCSSLSNPRPLGYSSPSSCSFLSTVLLIDRFTRFPRLGVLNIFCVHSQSVAARSSAITDYLSLDCTLSLALLTNVTMPSRCAGDSCTRSAPHVQQVQSHLILLACLSESSLTSTQNQLSCWRLPLSSATTRDP